MWKRLFLNKWDVIVALGVAAIGDLIYLTSEIKFGFGFALFFCYFVYSTFFFKDKDE